MPRCEEAALQAEHRALVRGAAAAWLGRGGAPFRVATEQRGLAAAHPAVQLRGFTAFPLPRAPLAPSRP